MNKTLNRSAEGYSNLNAIRVTDLSSEQTDHADFLAVFSHLIVSFLEICFGLKMKAQC